MRNLTTLLLVLLCTTINAQSLLDQYSDSIPKRYESRLILDFNEFSGNKQNATAKDWLLFSNHLEKKSITQKSHSIIIAGLTGVGLYIASRSKQPDQASIAVIGIGGSLSFANLVSSISNRNRSNRAVIVSRFK